MGVLVACNMDGFVSLGQYIIGSISSKITCLIDQISSPDCATREELWLSISREKCKYFAHRCQIFWEKWNQKTWDKNFSLSVNMTKPWSIAIYFYLAIYKANIFHILCLPTNHLQQLLIVKQLTMLIIRAVRKREVNSQVLLPAQNSECFKYVLENTRLKRYLRNMLLCGGAEELLCGGTMLYQMCKAAPMTSCDFCLHSWFLILLL